MTALFRDSDRKKYENLSVFRILIDEFNKLQTQGLNINCNGKKYLLRFQLCLITGDNLGLNEVLGFIDHFTHSRPCRICRATIDQIRMLILEVEELMRKKCNYEDDLNCMN